VPWQMFAEILSLITRLQEPPAPARQRRCQMRQTTKAEVCLDEGKSTSSVSPRRATRAIGCERRWLRPNFIAVRLDDTEHRANSPESGECRVTCSRRFWVGRNTA
jgi:hypothetical protein